MDLPRFRQKCGLLTTALFMLSARVDLDVDAIADWRGVHRALYMLWLDSGEYESYGKARLLDIEGAVNQRGLEIARLLSQRLPTHLWVWHDPNDGEPTHCPRCDRPLTLDANWGIGDCDACLIHL